MPKALDVDKDLAKSLYLQGVRPDQIADKLRVQRNTVYRWASRYNWTALLHKTKEQLVANDADDITMQLAEQSSAIRKQLASDLTRAASKLPKHTSTLNKFGKRQDGIGKLIANAATVFGWTTNSQATSQVNIAVLSVSADNSGIQVKARENTLDVLTVDSEDTAVDRDDTETEKESIPPTNRQPGA